MKNIFCYFFLIVQLFIYSSETGTFFDYKGCSPCNGAYYSYIQTGYAYSFSASIKNPNKNFWDDAAEGYNNNLGGSPYFSFGFGRSFFYYLRADVSYSFFQGFHYQKSQSGASQTIGFTGDRRLRFFDLDHQNFMFNISLYPERHFYFTFARCDFSPFIGVGVGAGFNRVLNFDTVAYVSGVGSTTSVGLRANNTSFAWQGFAGIRLHPILSSMSIDLGYRYYHGGGFVCPEKIYVNTPDCAGSSMRATPWRGILRTNQFMISLNYWF